MGKVVHLPAPASYATLHALALARHREAMQCKVDGDETGYLSRLEDVRALDLAANQARVREERRAQQNREFAAAIDGLLERALGAADGEGLEAS